MSSRVELSFLLWLRRLASLYVISWELFRSMRCDPFCRMESKPQYHFKVHQVSQCLKTTQKVSFDDITSEAIFLERTNRNRVTRFALQNETFLVIFNLLSLFRWSERGDVYLRYCPSFNESSHICFQSVFYIVKYFRKEAKSRRSLLMRKPSVVVPHAGFPRIFERNFISYKTGHKWKRNWSKSNKSVF